MEQGQSRTAPDRLGRRQLLRVVGVSLLGCAAIPLLSACGRVNDPGRYAVETTHLNQFEPASLTIPRGATVVWHNSSTMPHTSTAELGEGEDLALVKLPQGAEPWDSGDIYPGERWAHTFTTPGVYVYICRYEVDDGMVGTITVTE